MSDTVLSVNDCTFAYADSGFRLHVPHLETKTGEMLGIVGPNGCGKSTLLRLMAGTMQPESGRIELNKRRLSDYSRLELARELAFLPQSSSPAFEFTVYEVVALGRYPHAGPFGLLCERDRLAIEAALRETQTAHLAAAGRYFSHLSDGEKQRVLVASILAQEPRIMLLDEPTASLDIHHTAEVFDLLNSLARKGIAVVVVTHDLNAAGQFCDTLALLKKGAVVETGQPRHVLREDLLSDTYEAKVRVIENPLTDAPLVLVTGRRTHG
jgi:iron complex transport system ATP-binding protein